MASTVLWAYFWTVGTSPNSGVVMNPPMASAVTNPAATASSWRRVHDVERANQTRRPATPASSAA
jgi:hypothetical protein